MTERLALKKDFARDNHEDLGSFYVGEIAIPQPGGPAGPRKDARSTAERIKERRRALHMTQQGLSARTGLARAYLSQLEHGRRQGSIAALQKIAEVLQMETSELL